MRRFPYLDLGAKWVRFLSRWLPENRAMVFGTARENEHLRRAMTAVRNNRHALGLWPISFRRIPTLVGTPCWGAVVTGLPISALITTLEFKPSSNPSLQEFWGDITNHGSASALTTYPYPLTVCRE